MQTFSWLPWKEAHDIRKHHVSFELAKHVFLDSDAHFRYEGIRSGEPLVLGKIDGGLVLAVACTILEHGDHEEIQIISARRADKTERREYETQRGEKHRS